MGDKTKEMRRTMSAGSLIGDKVVNMDGEDLGKVEEIMLDVNTGHVAYAVLSFGGVLGVGNKLFAIPWQALALSEKDKQFYLNVSREHLENAPGFDKDDWPDYASNPQGLNDVYAYYGYSPYWN